MRKARGIAFGKKGGISMELIREEKKLTP